MAFERIVCFANDGTVFSNIESARIYEIENHIAICDDDIKCWDWEGEPVDWQLIVIHKSIEDVFKVECHTIKAINLFNMMERELCDSFSPALKYGVGVYTWNRETMKWDYTES